MRQDFLKLAGTAGENVDIDTYAPDSYILSFHNGWHGDETSIQKIENGDWDFVVLQEQSFFPLVPVLRDSLTVPAVQDLKERIWRARNCTQTILFMTWAWPQGGQFCNIIESLGPSCSAEFRNFFHMQDSIESIYLRLAQEMEMTIAPVGAAWKALFEKDIELDLFWRASNLSNDLGSYLAACVLYATIFQRSPLGNQYTSSLSGKDAIILQEIAERSVFDRRQKWRIDPQTVAHQPSFGYSINHNQVHFRNRSQNGVAYLWNYGDGTTSKEKDPQHAYFGSGDFEVCLQLSGESGCPRTRCETITIKEFVTIYPSPFQDELFFDFEENFTGPVTVEMFDVIGRRLGRWQLSDPANSSFHLSNLQMQAGTLLIKISTPDNEINQKIVKVN
ncbi:MAG: PKD domain-containing protein [Saprospiraceae bacterium]|nr:PKD domain-containing protein [Saprospiraceae bacterium]